MGMLQQQTARWRGVRPWRSRTEVEAPWTRRREAASDLPSRAVSRSCSSSSAAHGAEFELVLGDIDMVDVALLEAAVEGAGASLTGERGREILDAYEAVSSRYLCRM